MGLCCFHHVVLTCAKKRLEFCFETQLIVAFPWLVEGDHPHWGRISLGNFDEFYPVIWIIMPMISYRYEGWMIIVPVIPWHSNEMMILNDARFGGKKKKQTQTSGALQPQVVHGSSWTVWVTQWGASSFVKRVVSGYPFGTQWKKVGDNRNSGGFFFLGLKQCQKPAMTGNDLYNL